MKTCLCKIEDSPFNDQVKSELHIHMECPVVTGIIRTIAAEAGLGLKKNVTIEFVE